MNDSILSPATAGILLPDDGRQSPTALAIQRGTAALLIEMDFAPLFEVTLATGRRADIMAIGRKGEIWIIEIKSSVADFRADNKWPDYKDYCDRFFFAVSPDLPDGTTPFDQGLIVADQWGAEIMREAEQHTLNAARRKALTLRQARVASSRLLGQNPMEGGL